ncbi:MAG TPA: DUF4412 domain-containing protein [Vicinamibacteria bacterium]|nr:DUF4412 domain-containing protein [Vicinamibacteria bacterium]
MRSFYRAAMATASLALLAGLPLLAEDLTIVAKYSTSKGTSGISTTYLATDKVRIASPEQDTIMDLKAGRYVFVDHKKKEYWETTAAEMEAMAKQLEAQMSQMAEQMKNMPAAIRDKLSGGPIQPVTVQKGAGSKVIAGYTCEPYTVSMGDTMKVEMWVAPDFAFPPQSLDARKALYQGPLAQKLGKVFDEMKKIKGYPLLEVTNMRLMGIAADSTREVTEVRKGAIPAATFEVVAGYKKKDSPFKAR